MILRKRPAFELLPVPPRQRLSADSRHHIPHLSPLLHAVEIHRLPLLIAQFRHCYSSFLPVKPIAVQIVERTLLLPQASFENSRRFCRRITKAFVRQYPHSPALLQTSVRPLEPARWPTCQISLYRAWVQDSFCFPHKSFEQLWVGFGIMTKNRNCISCKMRG